jgi:hypothetical protein
LNFDATSGLKLECIACPGLSGVGRRSTLGFENDALSGHL